MKNFLKTRKAINFDLSENLLKKYYFQFIIGMHGEILKYTYNLMILDIGNILDMFPKGICQCQM